MTHLLNRREELSPAQALENLPEHPRRAARLLLQAATQGDVEAQAMLGQILLDGRGIQRDPVLALTWFRIAARQGHAMACNMVGRCLEHGWGRIANPAEAALYYRLAAERGLDWGLYNLANLLATGRGVPEDPHQAFTLYLQAAESGHAKSMNLVGRYLEEGRVVPADPRAAQDWYRRAAEGGDFRGQFSLAAVLIGQSRWEEARHWLREALVRGHRRFLLKALAELQTAALPALSDIVEAYARRCAVLERDAQSTGDRSAIADTGSPVAPPTRLRPKDLAEYNARSASSISWPKLRSV